MRAHRVVVRSTALDRWRDLLDVRDVCAAYAAALNADTTPGAIYNIASGTPRELKQSSAGTTRIELEHRHLERMGGKAAEARDAVDSPGGWGAILGSFKIYAES